MRDTGRDHGRDHGGDLDRAQARHGTGDWLDLSTGINRLPYPLPPVPPRAWTALPTGAEIDALEATARRAYRTRAEVVALAGAQAAIQLMPRLAQPGRAAVLAPSYNEHAASLRAQGWTVSEAAGPEAMAGEDLAVVVNPNNPDGRRWQPGDLLALAREVGLLVVDESFADPTPALSIAPFLPDAENVVVQRSFGKFYGLAGLRLGFAIAAPDLATRVRALAGPWAVNGPAIVAGGAALADADWQAATTARLTADAARLDALAARAGWVLVGGTALFRTFETSDAPGAQDRLARSHIWSRIFPYDPGWLRLGLPGAAEDWARIERALSGDG